MFARIFVCIFAKNTKDVSDVSDAMKQMKIQSFVFYKF